MSHSSESQLSWIDRELAELERAGLLRRRAMRGAAAAARTVIDGQELINFGSNDYLGLAADERLTAAARAVIEDEGWGSGASPAVSGRSRLHARLEARLAELEGTEAALLFSSGFATGAGTIPALVDRGDVIFADAKNHASLIDGCRLSRATTHVYAHADGDALEALLQAHAATAGRRLIVTDSLFSMDGDLAPLVRLAELADAFDCMLMVDEAHATGVFGAQGRGVAEHLGVAERVDVRMGTLSKALGSGGGFVAGSQVLIDWLANRGRSYVFSTAQPAALCAAALAALDIVECEPERREVLLERARQLCSALRAQGWNLGATESQIVPVIVGDAERTMQLAAELRERGLFVPGIRPPTVPPGESLLRISLSYGHTPQMIERLVGALGELV